MDLHPFGIQLTLTSETKFENLQSKIQFATHTSKKGLVESIQFPSGIYAKQALLGAGSYGATYNCVGPDSKQYAIKLVQLTNEADFTNALKECIIQILLAEESKHEPDGPFVPILYEIGYNHKFVYIRSELMDGTFNDSMSESFLHKQMPEAIRSIAEILGFFQTRLKFNHRDLHGENIMFKRVNGRILFKLIDFGFSCLNWKGLQINSFSRYFSVERPCFKENRDMSHLLWYITYSYNKSLSPKLLERLSALLETETNGAFDACISTKDCAQVKNCTNPYTFLNRTNVNVPKANPKVVIREMTRFLDELPLEGGMELPPRHAQSVAQVTVPQRHIPLQKKPCKEGKIRDSVTKRYKKAANTKQSQRNVCKSRKCAIAGANIQSQILCLRLKPTLSEPLAFHREAGTKCPLV